MFSNSPSHGRKRASLSNLDILDSERRSGSTIQQEEASNERPCPRCGIANNQQGQLSDWIKQAEAAE
jgi:hypothetical protein